MAMFHEVVRGCIEGGKYAARAGWPVGQFIWYDKANARISRYTGAAGSWNDPSMVGGSNAAYTLTMTDIIVAATGLPVTDWSFVG